MRPFGSLLPLEEAVSRTLAAATSVDRVETVPLEAAVGRVLAESVIAPLDVPGFDKAAMDGYAVRSTDAAEAGSALNLVGRSHAGEPFEGAVGPGECVEVATGAPVPGDCDAVIEVEETERAEGQVRLLAPVRAGRNVSPRGEDIRQGDALVAVGTVLQPGHLGAISSLGLVEIAVFARPRVAIFSTGREVRRTGPLGPGEVYDANTFTLAGLVRENGGVAEIAPPVPDEYGAMRDAVATAENADLVVLSGSTSVGERDFLREVAEELGTVLFHGVASKPGKPLLVAQVGASLVLGMPGFPASCILLAYHVLRPVLRTLAHLPVIPRRIQLPLAEALPIREGVTQLVTVHLEGGQAHKAFHKAGSITSVSAGEGYVVIPSGETLRAGDSVEVVLF